MKISVIALAASLFSVGTAYAQDANWLVGRWQGTVAGNYKDGNDRTLEVRSVKPAADGALLIDALYGVTGSKLAKIDIIAKQSSGGNVLMEMVTGAGSKIELTASKDAKMIGSFATKNSARPQSVNLAKQ
jgi:hypothetical protein